MEKFRELLFLNSIYRVGKKTIYGKYWNLLENSTDFDDLVDKMRLKFDEDKINNALVKSETLYNQIIENPEIQVVTVLDDNYPEKLKVMGNEKPLILYVKGNVDVLSKSNIAVIGTRKPSSLSQVFEQNLVKNIVNKTNRVIVSGLALGCDKIAHQATVDENKITIAVLPCGVNVIKPATNKKLAQSIIETGGCLVSEYEPDTKVNKGFYVERDKIVAAFSDATFVVECAIKSGTMHTVDAANDYKRQIYTYLPDEIPERTYDGNVEILENKDGIMVKDIEEFLKELDDLNIKKETKTRQSKLM